MIQLNEIGKKYSCIYADCPWNYRVYSKKGKGRSAENHYPTMNLEDIKNLPVGDLCDNGILFLWATYPNLQEAFEVMKAWGFTYKTVAFTWVKTYKSGKPSVGLGYWTRANPEICLLGTKGKNFPSRVNKSVENALIEQIGKHSQKPNTVRGRIVTLLGEIPRIELFAREYNILGFDAWGNEIPNGFQEAKCIETKIETNCLDYSSLL